MKRGLILLVLLVVAAFAAWTSGQRTSESPTKIEVVLGTPEYAAIEAELWSAYEEKHPDVQFTVQGINEDAMPAFVARIAAGDVPDITPDQDPAPDKDNYKIYLDLRTIKYPHWNKFVGFDGRTIWERQYEIPSTPGLVWRGGRYLSFVYFKEEMDKTGLDPRKTVRSFEDLEQVLGKLKAYTTGSSQVSYALDIGWDSWLLGAHFFPALANALGGDMDAQEALLRGKISWRDTAKNPYAPAFVLLKDWTAKGYLPPAWWTRAWESDMETSFIGRKSLMIFHGPWIWAKAAASGAAAKPTGFPMPTRNGKVVGLNVKTSGSAIFAGAEKKPHFKKVVDAFTWMFSPEMVKLRCEAYDCTSAMDLASVGGLNLKGPQFLEVAKPITDGFFGKVTMDFTLHPGDRVARFRDATKPDVFQDDALASILGDYISGKTSLDQLLSTMEKRWADAYTF